MFFGLDEMLIKLVEDSVVEGFRRAINLRQGDRRLQATGERNSPR
jgi:hypothetical protein